MNPREMVCILADHEDLQQPHPDTGECDTYMRCQVIPCEHTQRPVLSICLVCWPEMEEADAELALAKLKAALEPAGK